jgi:hypothetical protein
MMAFLQRRKPPIYHGEKGVSSPDAYVALGSMLLMGMASAVQLLKEVQRHREPPAPDHDLRASVTQLLKEMQRRDQDRGR